MYTRIKSKEYLCSVVNPCQSESVLGYHYATQFFVIRCMGIALGECVCFTTYHRIWCEKYIYKQARGAMQEGELTKCSVEGWSDTKTNEY